MTPEQWHHVEAYLRFYLSPEQCSGRLKLEKALTISPECIDQHIDKDKAQGGKLVSYLRCQKVRRKRYASGQERRGVLKNRVSIEQRPSVVGRRNRIGDKRAANPSRRGRSDQVDGVAGADC